jgi:oligopeptide transport system ATP-binding protein
VTGPVLEVRDLVTRFPTERGVVHAVNGISYTLAPGEALALVGESGSGKSVGALSLMGLVPPPGRVVRGEVRLNGRNVLDASGVTRREIRGREIAMVFQDPMTSLNPAYTVGYQIMEALMLHQGLSKADARARAGELLALVGIPGAAQRLDDYPHQFSGGMRQRAMIAMGLSCAPDLLIADEPTTALDVTIQAQIVDLVKRLQQELGMAVMWITHDLGIVAELAKKVNVMYAGYIIERGNVRDIFKHTRHPYTMGLLSSLPRLDEAPGTKLASIPGLPPDLVALPKGCPFFARCNYAAEQCSESMPPLQDAGDIDHLIACWRWEEIARGIA